ncbi:MAG: hypothetical protein ACOYI5_10035 [Christensenellales bacterium]|jgi:hypothetical protein
MKRDPEKNQDPFFDLSKVASANECTGIMPSLPQNEAEADNIASLFATHNPPPGREREKKYTGDTPVREEDKKPRRK